MTTYFLKIISGYFKIMTVIMISASLTVSIGSCSKSTEKKSASGSEKPANENVSTDMSNAEMSKSPESVAQKNTDSAAGLTDVVYGIRSIPEYLRDKTDGSIVAYAGFKDNNGINSVVITETELNGTAGKSLYGYHFLGDDGSQLLWKIQDFIRDCEVDITLEYIESSLTVSDINKNGIGESAFLYKLSCKGDVSPDDLKLIMHESDKKYAIRGSMDLDVTGYGLERGVMNIDPSFKGAPDGFKDFAVDRWNKFKLEKIGN